jgi:hypothetical protein
MKNPALKTGSPLLKNARLSDDGPPDWRLYPIAIKAFFRPDAEKGIFFGAVRWHALAILSGWSARYFAYRVCAGRIGDQTGRVQR